LHVSNVDSSGIYSFMEINVRKIHEDVTFMLDSRTNNLITNMFEKFRM